MERSTASSVVPKVLRTDPTRPRLTAEADVPILEARHGGLAERLENVVYRAYPFAASYVISNLLSLLVTALAIGLGLLITRTLLSMGGLEAQDNRLPEWLATHRTPFLNDASFYASLVGANILVGAVVVVGIYFAVRKRWRIAGFLATAIIVEVTTYRLIAGAVGRNRPDVPQLDHLNQKHSFPSGHTAASVAVYGGFAMLLTSRFKNRWVRILIWAVVVAILIMVGASRLYRGDHHPADLIGGALLGVGALLVAVLATRSGIVASERRPPPRVDGAAR